jgi:hypothetical protein
LFEKHREVQRQNGATKKDETIGQKRANITALGHFEPYKTHTLRQAQHPDSKTALELYVEASQSWENDQPGSVIRFDGSVLERTPNSVGRNPFLIIRVDKALIRDHNHIDDPKVTSFIRQLILIASQSRNPEQRKELRNRTSGK